MSEDPVEEIKQRKMEELQAAGEHPTPETPLEIDDAAEFQTIVRDRPVVLVDFHADWCGPCKQLAPIVEQLAAETPATVVKVDVDQHPGVSQQWNVRAVPTVLVFAEGEQVERFTGVQPYDRLSSVVEKHAPA